jgi:hypothetical protein
MNEYLLPVLQLKIFFDEKREKGLLHVIHVVAADDVARITSSGFPYWRDNDIRKWVGPVAVKETKVEYAKQY